MSGDYIETDLLFQGAYGRFVLRLPGQKPKSFQDYVYIQEGTQS